MFALISCDYSKALKEDAVAQFRVRLREDECRILKIDGDILTICTIDLRQ